MKTTKKTPLITARAMRANFMALLSIFIRVTDLNCLVLSVYWNFYLIRN